MDTTPIQEFKMTAILDRLATLFFAPRPAPIPIRVEDRKPPRR